MDDVRVDVDPGRECKDAREPWTAKPRSARPELGDGLDSGASGPFGPGFVGRRVEVVSLAGCVGQDIESGTPEGLSLAPYVEQAFKIYDVPRNSSLLDSLMKLPTSHTTPPPYPRPPGEMTAGARDSTWRIVLVNCYSDDNRGSAALNEAACIILRRAFPAAHISLIGTSLYDRGDFRHSLANHPDVQVLPPLLPETRLERRTLDRIMKIVKSLWWAARPRRLSGTETAEALRGADLVASCSGYLLVDRASVRGWIQTTALMLPMILARRLGIPTCSLPTSLIKPTTFVGRRVIRALVRSSGRFAVRDPRAHSQSAALGVRSWLYSDCAFVLPPPSTQEVKQACARYGVAGLRYAVLTARWLDDERIDRRKVDLQAAVVRDLLERGKIDRVLVLAQTVGPELDERSAAVELARAIGDRAAVLDGDFSHRDLLALYTRADVVLAQHLHSFLFATIVATPALVFSTDGSKIEGMIEGLGLPRAWVIDHDVEERALRELLDRLLSTRAEVAEQMTAAAARARDAIETLIRDLAAFGRAARA